VPARDIRYVALLSKTAWTESLYLEARRAVVVARNWKMHITAIIQSREGETELDAQYLDIAEAVK